MARIGVNIVVTEKLLNHAGGVSGGIVAVYQRYVNRRPIGTPDRHPIGTPSSYVSGD
jgi:hypothetical protein